MNIIDWKGIAVFFIFWACETARPSQNKVSLVPVERLLANFGVSISEVGGTQWGLPQQEPKLETLQCQGNPSGFFWSKHSVGMGVGVLGFWCWMVCGAR